MKIIFAGTPEFAATALAALLKTSHEIIAVYTQPDRKSGRGQKLTPSPVKQLALEHNIPVYQPLHFKASTEEGLAAQQELAALGADVMVVAAYGLILPQTVLDTPKYGCLNIHGSLLPRWRGAAPIQRAIWAGDAATGVTIMQMDAGLDTGAMLSSVSCAITDTDTSASLYNKLAQLGPKALVSALTQLPLLQQQAVAQDDSQACYAEKLHKDEALLDFAKSAVALAREIRAFNPWPVSYLALPQGNVKVWTAQAEANTANTAPGTVISADKQGIRIACADGVLCITQLQPPGKKPMAAADFLNGRADWLAAGRQV